MKHVLVTGYTGFVGKNLTQYLLDNKYQVTGVGRGMHDTTDKFKQITYSELSTIENCHAIIHLAGKAHDLKNVSNEAEYFAANTELTKKVFEVFLKSPITTDFIYLSSVKAAADSVVGELYETSEPRPTTAYGRSKLAAENFMLQATLPPGKRLFILRPCMIHGPGNKGNLNLLFQLVKKRIPYPLAAFNNKRSLVSIENLLFVIDRLLTHKNIATGVYNIADDEPLATNQIIDILAKAIGVKPRKWHINTTLITNTARLGDVLKLPLNTERLQKLTESYIVCNDKLKQALNIKKLPVSAKDGLLHTALNL